VENRLRKRAFKVLGGVECRNDVPAKIREGMEAPKPFSGVECRRCKPDAVTADERTVSLPGEEERLK